MSLTHCIHEAAFPVDMYTAGRAWRNGWVLAVTQVQRYHIYFYVGDIHVTPVSALYWIAVRAVYTMIILNLSVHANRVLYFQCPRCGAGFEQKHIINIYTPGDLFDGCSCMQVPFWSIVLKLISFQSHDLKQPSRSCLNCLVLSKTLGTR